MRDDAMLRVVVACLAAVVVIAALWWLLNWYIQPYVAVSSKDVVAARSGVIDLLAKIVGGLAIAVGTAVTWQNYRATRQLTERGQITDRFTKAIDQLGATDSHGQKRLEIRLGGIHALERIARDSPHDHWAIMEVLTAYVRENAPWLPAVRQNASTTLDATVRKQSNPPADIQAALTVIGRRRRWYGNGEEIPLDLRGTDLRGADFAEAHLEGAHLWQAHLEGARLEGADLTRAHLSQAHLEGADLTGAHLVGAYLRGAHLEGADLERASLTGAQLRGAHLEGAHLRTADLEGARLRGAHLAGAHMRGAKGLTRAMLAEAVGDETTQLPEGLKQPVSWSNTAEWIEANQATSTTNDSSPQDTQSA